MTLLLEWRAFYSAVRSSRSEESLCYVALLVACHERDVSAMLLCWGLAVREIYLLYCFDGDESWG